MKTKSKGIILTLDIAIAMLVMLIVIAMAYTYFLSSTTKEGLNSVLLRSYAQDAVTVLTKKGYLKALFESNDTSGIREVLSATPSSLCMQVAAYGTSVPDGLVGYWKFDEDLGISAYDSSGNEFTGILYNDAHFVEDGKSGRAVYLDGTDDYVLMSNDSKLKPQSVSVAAWVKLEDTGAPQLITTTSPSGYWLSRSSAGRAIFDIDAAPPSPPATSAPNAIKVGKWYFLVGTYDSASGTLRIYVNANETGNATDDPPINYAASSKFSVSTVSGAGDAKGYVDEVRIYNRALSQEEITELYSNPSNLLYMVDKPDCTYSGGEIQTIVTPFAYSKNQLQNIYYKTVVKVWLSGERS